ncbi:MAG TPA: hypothetical protein VIJ34_09845 [Acidimicrobiales bacterium]
MLTVSSDPSKALAAATPLTALVSQVADAATATVGAPAEALEVPVATTSASLGGVVGALVLIPAHVAAAPPTARSATTPSSPTTSASEPPSEPQAAAAIRAAARTSETAGNISSTATGAVRVTAIGTAASGPVLRLGRP